MGGHTYIRSTGPFERTPTHFRLFSAVLVGILLSEYGMVYIYRRVYNMQAFNL